MDKKILDELKQALLKEQTELNEELAMVANPDVGEHVPGDYAAKFPNYGDDNPADPGSDSPDEVQDYAVNLSVTAQLQQRLTSVKAALERMKSGTYGKDKNTGQDIPLARLQANPAAETNVK
ncbi:MAG: hypothetical protein WCW27_01445 [Patescibacteria group bacterium]|jgi:RNA polymerase-binding transcription factor DksA